MNKISVLLFLSLMALFQRGVAQNIGGAISTVEDGNRPNASKGEAGGDLVTIDHYTGTANVTVPIYDHTIDGLSLGVSLHYTAKGIRVDEIASPVGLGWQLNAAPEISRQVNGLEDEVTLPAYFSIGGSNDTVKGVSVPGANTWNIDDIENDLFSVNLGGRAISFGIKNGQVHTYPKSDVKVEVFTAEYNFISYMVYGIANIQAGIHEGIGLNKIGFTKAYALHFTIIDEKGNRFYFVPGDQLEKKYSFDKAYLQNDNATYYPIQKWVIDKVVTHSGQVVTYEYLAQEMEYLDNVFEVLNTKPAVIDWNTSTLTYDPVEIKNEKWKGKKYHIYKIKYPNRTEVSFNVFGDSSARCDSRGNFLLKHIRISSRFSDSVARTLTFRLNYSYLKNPRYSSSKESNYTTQCWNLAPSNISDSLKVLHLDRGIRLCLRSVEKVGADGNTALPYLSFGYDTTHALPYRFSPHKDYYGYYNGAINQPYTRQNFINPSITDTFFLSIPSHWSHPNWGVDRSHSSVYAKACILNKITNAMQGETHLEYQSYTLSNPDSAYGWVYPTGYEIDTALEAQNVNDGLCIWKITKKDPYHVHNTITTEYIFNGGQRFNRGGYTQYFDGNSNRIYTNNFIAPVDLVNGSNHGFSEVTIRSFDYTNAQLTKGKLYFTNLMYWSGGDHLSTLSRPTGGAFRNLPGNMRRFRMGMLQKSELYDETGFVFSKTENEFEEVPYGIQINNYRHALVNGGAMAHSYRLLDYEMFMLKKATYTRAVPGQQGTNTFVTAYDYTYDNKLNLKTTAWKSSTGEDFVRTYKYNYDYYSIYPGNLALSYLDDSERVFHISTEIWKVGGTDDYLLSLELKAPAVSNHGIRFPSTYVLNTKDPVPSSTANSTSFIHRSDALQNFTNAGSNFIRRNYATGIDANGNVTEKYIAEQDMYSGFIYDARGNMIAEATNARHEEIAFSSFEGDYTGMSNPGEGHLDYSASDVIYRSAMPHAPLTGNYSFRLTAANDVLFSPSYNNGSNNYKVSFWAAGNAVPVVTVFHPGGLPNSSWTETLALTMHNTVPAFGSSSHVWKLYTANFYGEQGSDLRITNPQSTNIYIDEVRVHPQDATMKSYTYLPLFGLSSENSPNNYIKFYEFDLFGRTVIERDMRGFIRVKKESAVRSTDSSSEGSSGSNGNGGSNG